MFNVHVEVGAELLEFGARMEGEGEGEGEGKWVTWGRLTGLGVAFDTLWSH